VSTLSTGPVAVSDGVGNSDRDLILRSCAADGKLLQPDRPAVRTDRSIYTDAQIIDEGPSGEVWSTHTVLDGEPFVYLLSAEASAYNMTMQELFASTLPAWPRPNHLQTVSPPPQPQPHPVTGVVTWETNSSWTPLVDATVLQLPKTDKYSFQLWTAVIKGNAGGGWTFMGEADSKWVPVSNDRFQNLQATATSGSKSSGAFSVDMTGHPGEIVVVMALPPGASKPVAAKCTIPESSLVRATFEMTGGKPSTTCADL